MPYAKGRGKPISTRWLDVGKPGGSMVLLEVYKKAGPNGGHTVGTFMNPQQIQKVIGKGVATRAANRKR